MISSGAIRRRSSPLWIVCALALAGCATTPEAPASGSGDDQGSTAPQVAWVVDVDQRHPMSPPGTSQPGIFGNRVVIGGRDRRVHVYDLHGNELRRIALEAPCESEALVMNQHLAVLGDVNGTLYGIDPQAGRILWRKRLSSLLLGHPVRLDDDFLIQTASNEIYRFSSTGEKSWSFAGPAGGLMMHQGPSPRVSGDAVYAVLTNGDVVSLQADSGDLVWRLQLLLDTSAVVLSEMKTPVADPVLAGNTLIVSFYQGDVIALSAKNGQQLWRRHISLKSTPLVEGDRLVATTSGGAVLALDVRSGETLWQQKLSTGELVGPVLSEGELFAADDRGHVYALRPDGRRSGKLDLPGRLDRAPVAVVGGILIRNHLGGLYLIR